MLVQETIVVIPWRGFRCFTLDGVAWAGDGDDPVARCNPLAGI